MRIAITGASGQLGRQVIEALAKQTDLKNIVALVRHPEKETVLKEKGVEVRLFDYNHTPQQLAEQLQDIDKILLISSSEVGKRIQQHKNVIDAVKQTNIKQMAYTSILNADTSPLVLAKEHVETEKYLKTLSIPVTLLRNGWYSENYAMGLKQALEIGTLLGATHHGKISSASRLDYATAAAIVLSQHGHENKTYELAGDHSYTLDDVAVWASEYGKKELVYQDLSEADYQKKLVDVGVPDAFASILADSDENVAKGGLYSESKDLHHLIGRETTDMKKTIKLFLS